MALIHNALRPGKVRSRPMLAREAGLEIFVEFRRWYGIFWGLRGLGEGVPPPDWCFAGNVRYA